MAQARQPAGDYRCLECLRSILAAATIAPPTFAAPGRRCASCSVVVSRELASRRTGEILCDGCLADPAHVVRRLLEQAKAGGDELLAVEGYAVEKELGRGGMGAVYLAKHTETGRRVALKVMLPLVAAGVRARDMFLREAALTQALRNPHVVRLFGLGRSQGTFFFTLEYCEGGSLADRIAKQGGPLSPEEATPLMIQALEGLEYAHSADLPAVRLADGSLVASRGLVHRDIKPNNIFLSMEEGQLRAKIGDYGLAKAFDLAGLSGMSATGIKAGTPVFMPRQQVVDFKYSKPEVDVWATAATLYYLLTRKYPRNFEKRKDPWQVVLQNDAIPIRERLPSVPKKLANVIDKALIDRPDIAIKSAEELRHELRRAMK
jgi:serine/threonine protein kinase